MSTNWLVSMTFVPGLTVDEKQLDALSDRFDELDWSVALGPDSSVSVTAFLDDDPWTEHLPSVIRIAQHVLADVGVAAEMVKIEAMTEEQRDEEATRPQLPDLVAATDVAKILGVSRQRVNQLHHDHRDFPQPVVSTGAGSLWTRYAIERFRVSWDRRPGRRDSGHTTTVVEINNSGHATTVIKLHNHASSPTTGLTATTGWGEPGAEPTESAPHPPQGKQEDLRARTAARTAAR